MGEDYRGMHASHCCKEHGCKYGDKDCPVVTGKVEQEYACEDCKEDPPRSDILQKYAKEIGIGCWTVERLIDSHRFLRNLNIQRNAEWRDTLEAARERGYLEGKQQLLEEEHISIERLRQMTIEDLCELIQNRRPEQ